MGEAGMEYVFTFKALWGETGRRLQRKPHMKQGLGTQLPSPH